MLLTTAQSAASLATAIQALNTEIAAINAAISGNFIVSGGNLTLQDPSTGNTIPLIIVTQSSTDSATILNTISTILNGKLTTASSSLTAL